MIVPGKPGKWKVVSEQGKPLSSDDLTRTEAKERLKEVERIKAIKKWADSKGAKSP